MKAVKILLLLVTIMALAGCGMEQRPSSNVKYFLLDVQRPSAETTIQINNCLYIRPCRVAAPFSSRSLVYRTSTVLYEQDYYNLYLTNPNAQLADTLRAWFRQAGFGKCPEDSSEQKYTLEPQVDVFCADFTDRDNPFAVVQMHVLVTKYDTDCSCVKIVLEKTLTGQTALPVKPSAAQVVVGLSNSLLKILNELENDLSKAMK